MKLLTKKIRLIPFEQSHWPYIYAWANTGDYDYFFGNVGPLTMDHCTQFNQNGVNLMIVNSANVQDILGVISLSNIDDRSRKFHYNVLVDKRCRRSGIAREASKLALYYGFNNLNFYKAVAFVVEENLQSKALTESFGFENEAVLKHEIYYDGDFKDVLRYRMLKGPFNKLYKAEVEELTKVVN